MTEPDTPTHPAGILTDAEVEALTDPETDPDELTDLRARVRDRLTETLLDLSVLYPTLPPEDFDRCSGLLSRLTSQLSVQPHKTGSRYLCSGCSTVTTWSKCVFGTRS